MMNLLDMPEEVLGEILRRLDVESRLVVWETCIRLRRALEQYAVMGRLSLTRAAALLWSSQLLDLAPHVYELSLSGLPALTAGQARSALPYFVNLRALDVTGTRLSMWDAGAACELCPSVTRLATRFDWPQVKRHLFRFGQERCRNMVELCQHSFRRLRHVRFVTDTEEILECRHVLHVLQLATEVQTLHIDILEQDVSSTKVFQMYNHFDCNQPLPPSLRIFSISNENCTQYSPKNCFDAPDSLITLFYNAAWQKISLANFENSTQLYVTDSLKRCLMPDIANSLETRSIVAQQYPQQIMWHERLEQLNHQMYSSIVEKVMQVLPQNVCQQTVKSNNPFISCRLYNVSPCVLPSVIDTRAAKRARLSLLNFSLDKYVTAVPNLRISVKDNWCSCRSNNTFRDNAILCFDLQSTTLRYLQFLSIEDCILDSSFEGLFKICKNLQTLILAMYTYEDAGFHRAIQNMHLSTSIKNFKCVGNIDACGVLKECVRCPGLETVAVAIANDIGPNPATFGLTVFDLYKQCPNIKTVILEVTLLNCLITRESLRESLKAVLSKLGRQLDVKVRSFHDLCELASADIDEFEMNLKTQNIAKLLKSVKFKLE